jgi:HPt (histidine-containing phosphotransfer) domain-containing protein
MTDEQREKIKGAGYDYQASIERFMNKEDLYLKFLLKFLADKQFDNLKAALEADDAEAGYTAAHTLKGVAGNLGITPVFSLASEIAEICRSKGDGAKELFAKLETEHAAALELIGSLQ